MRGKALAQPGRLGGSCPRGPCSSEGCPGAQTGGAEQREARYSVYTGSGCDGETSWPRCVCKRLCSSHEQCRQQKPVCKEAPPGLKPGHRLGLTQKMLSLGVSDSLFRVLWGLFSGISPFLQSVSGPSSFTPSGAAGHGWDSLEAREGDLILGWTLSPVPGLLLLGTPPPGGAQ